MAEAENAMDVFFTKFKENKESLDAMRTGDNGGGLSSLLFEAPLTLGRDVAEGVTSYGAKLGRGAVNGALAWGYDLAAANWLKEGKDGEAAKYAAAADFLRGARYWTVPGKPSQEKKKTDDGPGRYRRTPSYGKIMKRLAAMQAASGQGASPAYQQPTPVSPVTPQSVHTPQAVGSVPLSKKDARMAAMYYSALAYGMQQ